LFSIIAHGFATGLLLQLAIGPVFFFIANTAIQNSLLNAFVSISAVTMVDYAYIVLAIAGVGKALESCRPRKALEIAVSIIVIVFGFLIMI
jgi:arginine exporter protein ArgO